MVNERGDVVERGSGVVDPKWRLEAELGMQGAVGVNHEVVDGDNVLGDVASSPAAPD